MLSYNEIKIRKYIILDGVPYEVVASQVSRKQANKPTNQTKLKSLIDGRVIQKNFHSSEKVKEAEIEKKKIKYLYNNRGEFWFCEKDNPSKRFQLSEDMLESAKFMKEGSLVDAKLFNEKVIGISLPLKVQLKVKEAPLGVKGNTATGATKQVVLETGATINTPLFINEGDIIEVKIETGEYAGRI